MPNKKLLVIMGVLGGVLVLLILISIIIGASNGEKSITTPAVTPIPRTRNPLLNRGGSQASSDQNQKEVDKINRIKSQLSSVSGDERNKLKTLDNKLPLSTAEYDVGANLSTGQYYVSEKTSDAKDKFNQFLNDSGLSEVKGRHPTLFVSTTQPVDQSILESEVPLAREEEIGELLQLTQENIQFENQTTQEPEQDVQLLTDAIKGLINLNLGIEEGVEVGEPINQPPPPLAPSSKNQAIVDWASRISANLVKGCNGLYSKLSGFPTDQIKPSTTSECGGKYWCTSLVVDSYRLAGVKIPYSLSVRTMLTAVRASADFNLYTPTSNLVSQLQPGCVVFYIGTGEHVEILQSVTLDSRSSGTLTTISANSGRKGRTLSLSNGSVNTSNLPYKNVSFGCPK